MKFRLAKPVDLNEIVNIHYSIRENYNLGIFAQLDKSFLRQYYKIILNDKNGVIVCAESDGFIQGFCSASLDAESLFVNIRSRKIELGIAAIRSIIAKPTLLKSLFIRYKSTKDTSSDNFIVSKGCRLEYWAWSSANKDSFASIEMHEILLGILCNFGIKTVNFEVDAINKKIFLFHKYNGAKIIEKRLLVDGRERILMKYDLEDRKKYTNEK